MTVLDHHEDDSQYGTDLSARKLRELIADSVADGRPFLGYRGHHSCRTGEKTRW